MIFSKTVKALALYLARQQAEFRGALHLVGELCGFSLCTLIGERWHLTSWRSMWLLFLYSHWRTIGTTPTDHDARSTDVSMLESLKSAHISAV